jgi:hypothetical protein
MKYSDFFKEDIMQDGKGDSAYPHNRLFYENLCNESLGHVELKPIPREEALQFVAQHYLGRFPGTSTNYFGVYMEGELVGCVIYGPPSGPSVATHIAVDPNTNQSILTPDEVRELSRLFIIDRPGFRNIESLVLARSNKLLQQINPKIKVVITYADPSVGHVGTIYQATNAIYQGRGKDLTHWVVNRDGKQRTLRSRDLNVLLKRTGHDSLIGGSTENILKSGLPITREMISGKHRYIYILKDRKKIEPFLKLKAQPYPKKVKEEPSQINSDDIYE